VLPSSLTFSPWAKTLPSQIVCGCLGSLTSTAAIPSPPLTQNEGNG